MRSTKTADAEEELYRLQAEFCKGMAHSKRIHILTTLKGGEKAVADLARLTGIPQASVPQRLALLRRPQRPRDPAKSQKRS